MLLRHMQIQSLENETSSALASHWAGKIVYPNLLKVESTNVCQRAEDIGAAFFLKLGDRLHFLFFFFLTQKIVPFSLLPDING